MRDRLLLAAVFGMGASALVMACGGDDTFVSPGEDEDGGATSDATSPGADSGMGMVVDAGGKQDATTGDAAGGQDATSGQDASGLADTSTGPGDASADASGDAAGDAQGDAADAGETDAADASDAADAHDASDASDASDAADAADAADAGSFLAPKCDGTIGAAEYGPGVEGRDKYTSGGQVWHMTWDDTNLYIALETAPVDQPVLMYLDTVAAAGLTSPSAFDGIAPADLEISADLLVFEKTSYQVHETVAGAAWSAAIVGGYTVCDNNGTGQTREIVLPWKLSAAGRPTSFRFFGFPENGAGFIFGQAPTVNQSGSGNDTGNIAGWFTVSNTTPAGATSAFATVTLAGP